MATTPDALAREWFENVWNRLDESAIDRLMHRDATVHGLVPGALRGPAAFKPFFHAFRDALSNIRVTIERVIVQGDEAAVLCRVTAQHTGHALGPATGRNLDFHGITMVRVQDGQLIEGWNAFDFLTMYQQIGWVPNPPRPE
jgi:predicted ester cyclase